MAPAGEPSTITPAVAPAPAWVAHVLAGQAAAVLLALLDLLVAAFSDAGPRVPIGAFSLAGLHLVALYLPLGVVAGLVFAIVLGALGSARWLAPVRARVADARAWFRRDPGAFGGGIAALVALGVTVLVGRSAHGWLSTSVHREDLAAWAMGGVAAALIPLALVVFALSAPIAAFVARWLLGRFATLGTLALLILAASAIALAVYRDQNPEVRIAYGLPTLLWGPAALASYALVGALVVPRVRRWPGRRTIAVTLGAMALAALAFLLGAASYGESNRVRSVIEQRSVLGRRLVRTYAARTDTDGDHYTWGFGGGDCDDTNPDVHPGARDVVGDGVDSDCFAGDGSPEAETRSDGHFGTRPSSLPPRPNILVVTIDALRRDHLAFNGYHRDTSEVIDRFLAESVQFVDVVPQSSRSLRSIPAMWTGLYASEIAYGSEYLWPALLDENRTLAELLAGRGYETSAVMGTNYFERVNGFFQGFEDVVQSHDYVPRRGFGVDEALPRLTRLQASGGPWMLWVHLFNCHMPYLHDGTPSRFGGEPIDFYDTEIGLAGEQLERLLDALDQRGLADQTIVVLASDHGEAFGEHGSFSHSTTLYEEEMVPLLAFRIPGVAPRAVPGLAGLLDVTPTLANLAGVRLEAPVSGRSLVPHLDGTTPLDPERVVFSELLPDGLAPYDIKVARRGDEKLMWWVRDGRFQYFDLALDPSERSDLSDDRRPSAEALLGTLRAWLARSALPDNDSDALVRINVRNTAWTFERPLDIRYEDLFTVQGIDLPDRAYHPGDRIPLTFYYRVEGETDRDLFFVADLLAPPGVALPPHFHAWHYPIHSHHHTDAWREGTFIRDPAPIVVPLEVPAPTELTLTLTVRDGDVAVEASRGGAAQATFELARIRIEPAPVPAPEPPGTPTPADGAAPVVPP